MQTFWLGCLVGFMAGVTFMIMLLTLWIIFDTAEGEQVYRDLDKMPLDSHK